MATAAPYRARVPRDDGYRPRTRIDDGPRAALLFWGGGLLVAGLALVGVGAGAEGAPVALAGLFNTIYAIHTFGRLGPDDDAAHDGGRPPIPAGDARDGAAARASCAAWTGGLTALAGIVVVFDHQGGAGTWALTAYGLVVVGGVRLVRGLRELRRAREQGAAASRDGAPDEGEGDA